MYEYVKPLILMSFVFCPLLLLSFTSWPLLLLSSEIRTMVVERRVPGSYYSALLYLLKIVLLRSCDLSGFLPNLENMNILFFTCVLTV